MIDLPSDVQKYLKKFGMPGREAEEKSGGKYKYIVVIPALKEYNNLKKLILSLVGCDNKYFDKILVMIVVNNVKGAEEVILADNYESIEYLRRIINKEYSDKEEEIICRSGLNLALVDAATEGKNMPVKDGGVGFARKTGMDLALELFDYKSPGKNILGCLDADCTVEKNYFSAVYEIYNSENINAAHVDYFHPAEGSEKEKLAIICYEIFLRYYIFGLTFAKSPFAIHTIGSTMSCDAETYIKIQGMNKRKAAEDFYFMEKLAKITYIRQIKETRIYPSSRGSFRVPFGTGQRVNRYLSEERNEYLLYNPESFRILKQWLEIFLPEKPFTTESILSEAEKIDPLLFSFLLENKFDSGWPKIAVNAGSAKQLSKQKKMWFDGFRTLKFIHYLRDNGYPDINMFDALDEMFKMNGLNISINKAKGEIPPMDIQMKYLEILRENS